MNEITRNVILDLLPLYLSGEISDDTSKLVRKYLETDPDLAEVAEQTAKVILLNEIPVPLTKEAAMEKFTEAKRWMVIRTLGLAVIVAGFLCTIILVVPLIVLFLR
jgi:anti-sigma factor RsiW